MDSMSIRSVDELQVQQQQQVASSMRQQTQTKTSVWYCPSRWLMAHHDPQAAINTMSSHMCLADLNNDGEHLLALVDFRPRPLVVSDQQQRQQQEAIGTSHGATTIGEVSVNQALPPYDCRLRVYRGQNLIYSHFLDDLPACLIAAAIRAPPPMGRVGLHATTLVNNISAARHEREFSLLDSQANASDRPLLTLAINDDVYFYHRLKPSHKLSLEDDECIIDTLNKSEYDAWQMVRRNKVDLVTMRELLSCLSNELGPNALTCHSKNFLALQSQEERKNYLLLWKFKRLNNGSGEHFMSMDTICCAAARLKFNSSVTRSGDFGQTRETGTFLNNARWNKILDVQKDGLVLGTEDRHLLIYELRSARAHLEAHYRLPSTPDHILVERRSPASFDSKSDLRSLTHKIIVSCRNCRIYSIDQSYVNNNNAKVKELLTLKCNVLDLSWTCDDSPIFDGISQPNFVAACLDRRVYCFSSNNGHCKWVVEMELPITSIISLTTPRFGPNDSGGLIGVASQANRIDFYVSQTGRIVDSIYFANNDHCQAMAFGRFGREDNCLCLTTKLGHLLIFILKRTAKFAHGQCLSSAASHAADVICHSTDTFQEHLSSAMEANRQQQQQKVSSDRQQTMKLTEPASLPSAFTLTKSSGSKAADQVLDLLQSDHNCDQVLAKQALDAHLVAPQLQIPMKSRDFVDQIVEQSRNSTAISRVFARHMVKLRDKIKSTIEQQADLGLGSSRDDGNRITLAKVTGLGNTYRASLSLRLNLRRYAERHHLLSGCTAATVAGSEDQAATSAASANTGRANDGNKDDVEDGNSSKDQQANTRTTGAASGTGRMIVRFANNSMADFSANNDAADSGNGTASGCLATGPNQLVSVFVFVGNKQRWCQVKPFRFELVADASTKKHWILERTIEFKLLTSGSSGSGGDNSNSGQTQDQMQVESESVSLDVYVLLGALFANASQCRLRRCKGIQSEGRENSARNNQDNNNLDDEVPSPVFISSVNIPTC